MSNCRKRSILISGDTSKPTPARKRASRRVAASIGWEIGSNGSAERVRHKMERHAADDLFAHDTIDLIDLNMSPPPTFSDTNPSLDGLSQQESSSIHDFGDLNFHLSLIDCEDGQSDFSLDEEESPEVNMMQQEMQENHRLHVKG